MKKYLILLLLIGIIYKGVSQPLTDDVRVVTLEFASQDRVVATPAQTIHNQVYLNFPSLPLLSGLTWWYVPEDPTFGPELELSEGLNGPINFPISASNTSRIIGLILKAADGSVLQSRAASIIIKTTNSLNGSGFTPPDETWEINTTATYTPPVAGAFPSGSPYIGNNTSGGHAYIKFAPATCATMYIPVILHILC